MNATTDTDTGNLATHTGDLPFCVANASAGDNVEFDPSLNGQTIKLNSEIQVSQNGLNILGETPGGVDINMTIDGQANTRLFEIIGGGNATINMLTLTNGSSSGNGGAVLVDPNATLSAYADTFTNDKAVGNGGAIENNGNTTASTCAFSNDTAGGNGGAIENTNQLTVNTPTSTPGYPTISNFVADTAVGMGGAIDSSDAGIGQVNISNTNFYSNTAPNGGAVSTADSTTLDTDTFGGVGEANSATSSGGNGGAVYALQNPNLQTPTLLTATGCTFADNTATGTGSGGAIYSTMSVDVEGSSTLFNGNTTADGDGGAIEAIGFGSGSGGGGGSGSGWSPPSLTVNGATLENQTATGGNGGAINSSDGTSLTNVTFTNNWAVGSGGNGGNGGAVYAIQDVNGDPMNVTSCAFNTNQATGSGGAIFTNDTTNVGGPYIAFDYNSAGVDGGAIESCPVEETFPSGGLVAQARSKTTSTADAKPLAPNGPVIVAGGPVTINPPNVKTFDDNKATGNGGYISSDNKGAGNLSVTNINFIKDSADNGGAIYTSDKTTLTNDTFGAMNTPNTAAGSGGAIDAAGALNARTGVAISVPLTVTNCTLAFNTAGFAGGAIASAADTYVTNSYFHDNSAAKFSGGAIGYTNLDDNGKLRSTVLYVVDDYFQNNQAQSANGGAVAALVTATSITATTGYTTATTVNDCTFDTNKAVGQKTGLGGGVYVEVTTQANSQASTDLNDDTFYNNSADSHGGAVTLKMSDPGNTGQNLAYLTSDTITQNQAPTDSGGVYVISALKNSVSVDNSILSGNTVTAPAGPVDFALFVNGALDNTNQAGVLVDNGYNLAGTSDTMFNPANVKSDISNDKPGLGGGLAANGTAVMAGAPGAAVTVDTLAVPNTSPGYRAGDPKLAGGTDERGKTRQAGKVSIGAMDPDAQ